MSPVFVGDPIEWILPAPVYLVAGLGAVAGWTTFIMGRRLPRLIRLGTVVLFIWAYVATLPGVANALLWSLEGRVPPVDVSSLPRDDSAVILVLASGYGKRTMAGPEVKLGEAGWERVAAGVGLWRVVGGRLMFIGQPVEGAGRSVAERMAEAARHMGVPPDVIDVERSSATTYENLRAASRRTEGRHGARWVVSSASHLPRVLAVARKLGLSLKPFGCDYRAIPYRGWRAWLPHNNAIQGLRIALHEYLGLWYYRWKGWA